MAARLFAVVLAVASVVPFTASAQVKKHKHPECAKLKNMQAQIDCVSRAQRREAAAKKRAERNRPKHVDERGRKIAHFKLMGIKPEAEQKALEGDVLKSGFGVNNVMIVYGNEGRGSVTSSASKIYTPVYNQQSKHYTGWEKVDWAIRSAATKPRPGRKKKRRRIKLGKGVDFSKSIKVKICAKTVFDNCFWTEFTATVEGDEEKGFTIPGEFYLDRYSRTMGRDNEPKLITAKEEREQKRARLAAARKPKQEPKPAPKPKAPAAQPKPKAPPKEITLDEAASAFSGAWRRVGRKGRGKKGSSASGLMNAMGFTKQDMTIRGFSSKLAQQLKEDPVHKKRKVKIRIKNKGERKWGNVKSKKMASTDPKDLDITFTQRENIRVDFDKPMVIRVEVRSASKGEYWTEVERTKDDLSDPIEVDHYTAR